MEMDQIMNQENLNYFKDIVDHDPALKLYMSPLQRTRLPRNPVGLGRARRAADEGRILRTGVGPDISEERLQRLRRAWDRLEDEAQERELPDTGH